MLWALEGPGMLRWGTHRGTGRLAGSRLASSLAGMMMLMLSRPSAGLIFLGSLQGSSGGGRFSLL